MAMNRKEKAVVECARAFCALQAPWPGTQTAKRYVDDTNKYRDAVASGMRRLSLAVAALDSAPAPKEKS
jgi:hypothetical protein